MSLAGRLAIVVITRDRRAELLRTLDVLAALPEPLRTVVVDNASSDGTVQAVRHRHPGVEVVVLARNEGAAARNVGVARLDEPYVAFCDDDSWWEPGALEEAVALMDAHPRLAVLQAHVLVGEDERDDPVCLEMARSPLPPCDGQPGHPLLSFICCAAVVRREAFQAVGGFSPRLQLGGEEEIFGHDLAAAGWLQSYVPWLRAHHHPSTVRDSHHRREVGIRNTLWTTWLRRPARPALRRTVALLRRLPRDRVSARGVARALTGLPWVLRERAPSPPHVEAMRALLDRQQLESRARRYVS